RHACAARSIRSKVEIARSSSPSTKERSKRVASLRPFARWNWNSSAANPPNFSSSRVCLLRIKSKAERGYALIAGEAPQAVKAAPVALTPDCSRQAAFQAIARACLRQLVANQPATLGGDPEGLHQMRVALRRLRAAVSLFADMLVDPQTEEMKTQFKWITQELGPARELDVFMKRVVRPVTNGKPNGPGVAVLAKDLQRRREEAFDRACSAVESTRFRSLVLDTACWIEAGDWTRNPDDFNRLLREQPIVGAAADELRRRWKKILKAGGQLD